MLGGGGGGNAAKAALLFVLLLVGLSANPAEAYDAKIEWRAVAEAKSYRVYVRYNDGAYTRVAEKPSTAVAGTVLSNTVSVTLATNARFAVTSVSDGGAESGRSNDIAVSYAEAAQVADTDGDGLTNAQEDVNLDGGVGAGETDPRDADTDDDGLSDSQERNIYGTDPLNRDTDGDGFSDGSEVAAGTNPRQATVSSDVYVLAASHRFALFSGKMRSSTQYTAGTDSDPAANSVGTKLVYAASTTNALTPGGADWVSYPVKLPKAGQWYAWGRFYYPGTSGSNDANSFWLSVDSKAALRFGNESIFKKWHWDGDGSADFNGSVALPLGYLAAGTHVITVAKREVSPIAPRLDVLLLTLDGKTVPKDAQTNAWVAQNPPPPTCTSNAECDDRNPCNGSETCDPAVGCRAGTALACDDGNKCNGVETCNPTSGCVHTLGPVCNDGQFCNGVETCDPAVGCVAGVPVNCGAHSTQCKIAQCDEQRDACAVAVKAEGTVCNDGLACTVQDICVAGTCTGADTCGAGESCSTETGMCEAEADTDNDGLVDGQDPCPDDARNFCFGDVATDRKTGKLIRINAGKSDAACSGARVDCNGDTWYEDFGSPRNAIATSCTLAGGCPIFGVDSVFGCESEPTEDVLRCDTSSADPSRRMGYTFDVPNGVYVVNLHFANTQTATTRPGSSVFDIYFEGLRSYRDFDQVVAAGGSAKAVVRSEIVEVTDGNGLSFGLQPRVGAAAVKAIEVLGRP